MTKFTRLLFCAGVLLAMTGSLWAQLTPPALLLWQKVPM